MTRPDLPSVARPTAPHQGEFSPSVEAASLGSPAFTVAAEGWEDLKGVLVVEWRTASGERRDCDIRRGAGLRLGVWG